MRKPLAILAILALVLSGTLGAVHPSFASTPGSRVYVTNFTSPSLGTVSVIDGSTNTVSTTVNVGVNPFDAAFDSTNGYLYVSNALDGTVSVMNPSTNTVVATVTVGNGPEGLAFDPLNGYVYVTNSQDGAVSVIDGSTNTVTTTLVVGNYPTQAAFDSATDDIYVSNFADGTVTVIDAITNIVVNLVTVGGNPTQAVYDPDVGDVYVANFDGTVSVINALNMVTGVVPVGGNLFGVALDSYTGYIYVSDQGGYSSQVGSTVWVIDPSTNFVVAPIVVGYGPTGVAIDPTTGYIYVANSQDGSVSVIDDTTNTVTATVNIGGQPFGVAVVHSSSYSVSGVVDQFLCTNNGGFWDVVAGSCTIPATVEWDVAANAQLDINSYVNNEGIIQNELGGEVYLSSAQLNNAGTFNNYGIIVSVGGFFSGNPVNNVVSGLSGGYIVNEYFPTGLLSPLLCNDNGATWDAATYTCTIPSTTSWVIAGLIGNSLTIQAGQHLVINQSVNDYKGVYAGIMSNAGKVTNYGGFVDNGLFVNFKVLQDTNLPTFINYGTIDVGAGGQFVNQGILTNEAGATITNGGYIGNLVLAANSGTITNTNMFYEFCGAALTGNAVAGVTYLCAPTRQDSATTTIAALSDPQASSDQTAITGISVAISGSTAPNHDTVIINTEDLTSPESGVSPSLLVSGTYYDVSVFGVVDGTASICIDATPSTGQTMQYWGGSTWADATGVTTVNNQVCGNIPVSALTGTNIVVGASPSQNPPGTGVPEFPAVSALSPILLVAFLLPALVVVRRKVVGRVPR